MKVIEIFWQEDKMYGQIGVIGGRRLIAFYPRIVSQSEKNDNPYTLECFIPSNAENRSGKWRVRNFEVAKQVAQRLLAEFLDSVTRT